MKRALLTGVAYCLLLASAFAQDIRVNPPTYIGPISWSPSDASGAGLTFTTPTALYVRIGNVVIAQFRVTYPSTANASNAAIGGLPIASNSNGASFGVGSCAGGVASNVTIEVVMSANATSVSFFNQAGTQPTNTTFSTSTLTCQVTYISN